MLIFHIFNCLNLKRLIQFILRSSDKVIEIIKIKVETILNKLIKNMLWRDVRTIGAASCNILRKFDGCDTIVEIGIKTCVEISEKYSLIFISCLNDKLFLYA